MQKIRENERTDKKSTEVQKSSALQDETRSLAVSAKNYLNKSLTLYRGVFSRLSEKISDMLLSELGEEGVDYKKRTKSFLFFLLFSVLCFFISSTSVGTAFPFSISLVSSAGSRAGEKSAQRPRLVTGIAFFSAVFSTLRMGGSGLVYFTVLVTLFILRSVVTSGKFDEGITYRTMSAFFAGIILSSFVAVVNSFSLESLFSGLCIVVSAPLFSYLFSGFFVSIGEPLFETGIKMRVEVGLASLYFAFALALSEIALFGFALNITFAFAATCLAAKIFGSMHGGVFGMLGGMSSGSGIFSSALGAVGVVSAVFFSVSDLLALSVGVFVASAVSVYIGGFSGFVAILPEVLFGSLVVYPIIKALPSDYGRINFAADRIGTSDSHERESVEKQLGKMSGSFETLSEIFFAVTDTLRTPNTDDVVRTVNRAYTKVCATCSMSGMCWSRHYTDTNDVKTKIAEKIIASGRASKSDFPEHFSERCIKLDAVTDEINRQFATLYYVANDLTHANLIAGEYRTVSKLLQSTARSFKESESENIELAKKASRAMKNLATPFGRVEAWGRRKSVIDVFGVQPERIERTSGEILANFESECGMLFEEPEFIKLENTSVLRMRRRTPITLECAKKSTSKKSEKVNGDSITFFEKDDGHFYALICDGMGSGRDAALTSRLASVFLEKLLTCTDDKKATLEMLNSMLMAKKDECFTTLDLIEVDLFESHAGFIKAGAAPSFIIRGDKVYKVNSATLPAGILSKISVEETKIPLKSGDMIIMLSDGITDRDDSENAWFVEFIAACTEKSPSMLADKILSETLTRFGAADDMSVVVLRVY